MEFGLIRITPDKQKAHSILKMADVTIEMIKELDIDRFSSNITKDYYDIIRELFSIILLDGYKTYGEGAHKKLIEYIQENYKELDGYDISLVEDLRIKRNKIAYDGFFIGKDYIVRKIESIHKVIEKLKIIISNKI